MRRIVFLASVAVVGLTAHSATAANWVGSGAGLAAARAGTLAPASSVVITGCAGNKSGNNFSASLTVTWTVSGSAQVTGQTFNYVTSGTTTQIQQFNNNTTASVNQQNVTGLNSGVTYTVTVVATRQSWSSTAAISSKSFSLANNNGSCTVS